MKIDSAGGAHLTYCTNVHPSESWPEVERALGTDVLAVKKQVSPDAPFGVGLRLSARAAKELLAGDELERLRSLLKELGLYVFTLNGFPYGPFHGQAVKEKVYQPDWRAPQRAQYTDDLVSILNVLLPDGETGSISTVPGGFRSDLREEAETLQVADAWLEQAAKLWKQKERTGRSIVLAIEPEPSCLLETTAELIRFFELHLLSKFSLRKIVKEYGLSSSQAEHAVRDHLGICLDACHAAVEFEDPIHTLSSLQRAAIAVGKVQLSSGLKIPHFNEEAKVALAEFEDPVYLHQTVVRRDGQLHRYVDVPEALRKEAEHPEGSEWRIHFHVPIFREALSTFRSTQDWLRALLSMHSHAPVSNHLEVETYSWGVLPEAYRAEQLDVAIARELDWVLRVMDS